MSQSISIVGVKSESKSNMEINELKKNLKGIATCYEMNVKSDRFKLGSLDSMLLNLERAKKLESLSENFLKRIEKIYLEISSDKSLVTNKLDSNVGPSDITKFLTKFEWDDVRFPRSSSLFDQIKHMEEKLQSMEKNLKIKQGNYNDSKSIISNTLDKKQSMSSFINNDLNDTVLEIIHNQGSGIRSDLFVNSDYLQSIIVFVPQQNLEEFTDGYESQNEYILPKSFVKITEKFGYVMGHIIAFKKSVEDIKNSFRDNFKTIAKEFEFEPETAQLKKEEKKKIISQNKTDLDLLNSACIEGFKEVMVMVIHLKVYLVIIDSSLRFGSMNNFIVALLFFDKSKQARVVNKLIQIYAEKDKLEFYGTKEQLNDVEDFFPYVWTVFTIYL
jgi:V-type H+-transporting ATPase subunit C